MFNHFRIKFNLTVNIKYIRNHPTFTLGNLLKFHEILNIRSLLSTYLFNIHSKRERNSFDTVFNFFMYYFFQKENFMVVLMAFSRLKAEITEIIRFLEAYCLIN